VRYEVLYIVMAKSIKMKGDKKHNVAVNEKKNDELVIRVNLNNMARLRLHHHKYKLYVVFGSISNSSGCIYAHLVQTNKYMSIRSKVHTKTS